MPETNEVCGNVTTWIKRDDELKTTKEFRGKIRDKSYIFKVSIFNLIFLEVVIIHQLCKLCVFCSISQDVTMANGLILMAMIVSSWK